jgi:hypothetical protein
LKQSFGERHILGIEKNKSLVLPFIFMMPTQKSKVKVKNNVKTTKK